MINAIPPILSEETTLAWLSQFDIEDQERASKLVGSFLLVSHDEFHDNLRALLTARAMAQPGPVALYSERELPKRFGVPHRLFKESNHKVKRAEGIGPQPVKPIHGYAPDVGSEGLVARLVSELCRSDPKKYINHPGPDEIRRQKVRRFLLVTDLVGSGRRAQAYLEAAWRVRSVRSWWSLRLMRFEVVSYATTRRGRRLVEKHPCAPLVSHVVPCPTIDALFARPEAAIMKRLCTQYDPKKGDIEGSLGVGGLGTLIAFAHGVPNNAPRIFHKAGTKWAPLFPARVTSGLPSRHFGITKTPEAIRGRLISLRRRALARAAWLVPASDETRKAFLVMAATGRSPRTDDIMAMRTGLTIIEIEAVCRRLIDLGWINVDRRLTDAGRGQLAHAVGKAAAQRGSRVTPVAGRAKPQYYPQSLRSPTVKSR